MQLDQDGAWIETSLSGFGRGDSEGADIPSMEELPPPPEVPRDWFALADFPRPLPARSPLVSKAEPPAESAARAATSRTAARHPSGPIRRLPPTDSLPDTNGYNLLQ